MMITRVNFNKCRAMKKIITSILIAAAAFTACVQNNDEVIVKSDKVTFNATIDAPASRTVLVEQDGKFHAEWCEGDIVELFEVTVTDGKLAKNTPNNVAGIVLAESGLSASFEATLGEATADSFYYLAATNNPSMNGAATYIAYTLPNAQAPKALNTYDAAADKVVSKMVACATQPTEPITFEMTRISAIAKVSVKNLSLAADDAVQSVTFTCAQPIAGKVTNILTQHMIEGTDPMADHSHSTPVNSISVTLPEAQTGNFSYYMCVWPETLKADEAYSVKVVTTAGKEYVKEGTIAKDLVFTSGNITAFTVNMAGIGEDIVTYIPYVEVAGIKWATGNLEYEVGGTTGEGFATGWCIAPSQEHHFYHSGYNDDGNVTATDYNKVAHFNFGGITDAFTNSYTGALHVAAPAEGADTFDLSGKMYTDSTCATATTNFADAKYGDIAFWASNGQYRMPTEQEFATLYANSCYTVATYNSNGINVSGTYFYNPGEGETAGEVEGTKVLFDSDLLVGLFLPYSGRAYNNTEYNIYKINTQGYYRTSTVASVSKSDMGYGVIFRVNDHTNLSNTGTKKVNGNTTYNFGATSRYAIRPIYIAE